MLSTGASDIVIAGDRSLQPVRDECLVKNDGQVNCP